MAFTIENISDFINVSMSRLREERSKELILFFLLCVSINLIGGIEVGARKLLYLDMLGTAFAGIALGPWWGASVGMVTNLLLFYMIPTSPSLLVFALINVLGGLYWGYMCNIKWLRPLEGITSVQKIFSLKGLLKSAWFVIISGGLALSIPTLYILRYVLNYIDNTVTLERYIYYISVNITDKLLSVVIATVVICAFFPVLSSHLQIKKAQWSYGVSGRSIIWFCIIYLYPCYRYFVMYPEHWYLWVCPYILALLAYINVLKSKGVLRKTTENINIDAITFGGLFWLIVGSFVTFAEFIYFATINISSKFAVYHDGDVIKYKDIFVDAFSLSLVIMLIGVVFTVLIQAIKQRENREIIRQVEIAKDKIATDIHNDPLQLISVLNRKISTMNNQISNIISDIEEIKPDINCGEKVTIIEKHLNDLNKTFSNYYATYLPELDSNIRKIIRPLSQKESKLISKIGLIQKIKDILNDFKEKNAAITVEEDITLSENDLPKKRSDNSEWKVESIKILREIFNNIEKHSNANKVNISIEKQKIRGKQRLIIAISDNGVGFRPQDSVSKPESFGIYEITTRAKYMGANLTFNYIHPENPEMKGTMVKLDIPYDY